MEKIDIGLTLVTVQVGDNPDNIVRFDPADYGLISRVKQITKSFEGLDEKDFVGDTEGKEELDIAAEAIDKMREKVYGEIDKLFYEPVCNKLFGDRFSTKEVESFLTKIIKVMGKYIEKEQKESQKRLEKYLPPQKQKTRVKKK
ncbi:MAG: hypothetical protein LBL34_04810 [Clostridiales bacterium]|jgi:hypothetical protein|nr:hypothetical protein [Clostridiales bacterium]